MFDEKTLLYWQEIRSRLIKVLLFFLASFLLAYVFSNPIYTLISWPVRAWAVEGVVSLSLVDMLMTPLRISWFVAWLFTVPVFFYHLCSFLLPALYPKEKHWFVSFVITSIVLYYLGVLFAFCLMVPFFVYYISQIAPAHVSYLPDMKLYVDFVLSVSLTFGWIFELPVVMVFLVHWHVITLQSLRDFRKYFVVIAFTLGMLLTPPDVLSQCLVAVPICLIYEAAVFFLSCYEKKYLFYRSGAVG